MNYFFECLWWKESFDFSQTAKMIVCVCVCVLLLLHSSCGIIGGLSILMTGKQGRIVGTWQEGSAPDLLRGAVGGHGGGFGEGDLHRWHVRRQRVGDALHQVAHLGAAAHRNRDGFGNGRGQFRHLLQQHGGGARRVGSPPLTRFLVLIGAAHAWQTQRDVTQL